MVHRISSQKPRVDSAGRTEAARKCHIQTVKMEWWDWLQQRYHSHLAHIPFKTMSTMLPSSWLKFSDVSSHPGATKDLLCYSFHYSVGTQLIRQGHVIYHIRHVLFQMKIKEYYEMGNFIYFTFYIYFTTPTCWKLKINHLFKRTSKLK